MSIAAYLEQSRRSKPASKDFLALYRGHYEALESRLPPGIAIPRLNVIYSSERRCEFVRVSGTGYILYDQYLGQSFNALNRILLAAHSHSKLARSYACKYLAERFLTLGCYGLAQFFGLCYRQLDKDARAERNPFYQDVKLDAARLLLTNVQEIFVLAHEISHHLLHSDEDAHLREVSARLREFIWGADPQAPRASALAEHYQGILQDKESVYLPEFFADDTGGAMTMQVATDRHNIPTSASSLGIRLAFRYLRLFRHLELLARRLAPLETVADPDAFRSALVAIDDDVWDKEEGRIAFFQLREHFLLYRLRQWQSGRARDKVDISELLNCESVELVDQYDKLVEAPVLMTLVDSLKEHFRADAIMDLRGNAKDHRAGMRMVDRLTGWSMTTDLAKLKRIGRKSRRGR